MATNYSVRAQAHTNSSVTSSTEGYSYTIWEYLVSVGHVSLFYLKYKPYLELLMTRSDPKEPSGSKRSRLTLKGRRGKKKDQTALEEQKEKEDIEQGAIKAQEAADFDMANELQAEAELDAIREETDAWNHQQAINPDTNPLLMPREER